MSQPGPSIKTILVPSLLQLVVCLVLGLALLLLVSSPLILAALSHQSHITTSQLASGVHQQLAVVDRLGWLQNAAIVVFWAAIGWAFYLVTLIISNAAVEVHNGLVIRRQFVNQGPSNIALKMVIKLLLVLIGFGLAFIAVRLGIMGLAGYLSGYSWQLDLSLWHPLAAWAGMSACVYVAWTGAQLGLYADELL